MPSVREVLRTNYLKLDKLRKGEFVSRLNNLHKFLGTVSQEEDERPEGLNSTAGQLVSEKILRHNDKDVRLLAACCLADIFRIYAPDAPFAEEEQVAAFEIIVTQLRGLATTKLTTGSGEKIFYILHSLSTVKSCVIPVILGHSGIAGAQDIVASLFEALISSVNVDHSDEVLSHVCTILCACIEESDDIDQDLLDTLLAPLVPGARGDNPTAFKVVCSVLRQCSESLQVPMIRFFNLMLLGAVKGEDDSSDLSEHVYALLFELHTITPSLLVHLFPNICVQLLAEEVEIRLKAVKLVGRLFASQHSDFEREFSRNFRDFIARFKDKNAEVRLEMLHCASQMMEATSKSHLLSTVEENMVDRLRDADKDVRLSALNKLIRIAMQDPLLLSERAFEEIGERAKDRNGDVHCAAATGLAKVYAKHLSSKLPPLHVLAGTTEEGASDDDDDDDDDCDDGDDDDDDDDGDDGDDGDGEGGARDEEDSDSGHIDNIDDDVEIEDTGRRRNPGRNAKNVKPRKRVSTSKPQAGPKGKSAGRVNPNPGRGCPSQAAPQWRSLASGLGVREDILARLSHVPGLVVNYWGYPDITDKHVTLQLLQEYVLPKTFCSDEESSVQSADGKEGPTEDKEGKSHSTASNKRSSRGRSSASSQRLSLSKPVDDADSESKRATALLFMYHLLNSTERNSLGAILGFKTKVKIELAAFLSARSMLSTLTSKSFGSAPKDAGAGGSQTSKPTLSAATAAVKSCAMRIQQLVPPADKKSAQLDKLAGHKDRTIFRHLGHATAARDSMPLAMYYKEDVIQRLDSKSAIGIYCGLLYDFAGFFICNEGMVCALMDHVSAGLTLSTEYRGAIASQAAADASLTSQLVRQLSKHAAPAFRAASPHMSKWLSCGTEGLRNASASKQAREAARLMLCHGLHTTAMAGPSLGDGTSCEQLCEDVITMAAQIDDADMCKLIAETAAKVHACAGEMAMGKALGGEQAASGGTDGSQDALKDHMCKSAFAKKIRDLCQSRSLSLSNKRLSCDLSSLAAYLTVPTSTSTASGAKYRTMYRALNDLVIDKVRKPLLDFIRSTILSPTFIDSGEAPESADGKRSSKGPTAVIEKPRRYEIVGAALRVWTSLVSSRAELDEEEVKLNENSARSDSPIRASKTSSLHKDFETSELQDLLSMLTGILESSGCSVGGCVVDASAGETFLRQSAAECAISMLRLDAMLTELTVDQWKVLGWSFLDTNENIRRQLFASLSTVMQTNGVHLRYFPYACLLAVDEKLSAQAEQIMRFAINRLRVTHEQMCRRALSEENESIRLLAEAMMPETMLPYVLYLLSYHPNFPRSTRIDTEEDERRIEGIIRSVKMVLRVLFATLSSETDNLPFLLKQVNTISQRCRDRHDPQNVRLQLLSRLTLKMLNENIRTSENTQNLSAAIRLPEDLFEFVEDGKHPGGKNQLEGDILKGIQKSEKYVEKAARVHRGKVSPASRVSAKSAHPRGAAGLGSGPAAGKGNNPRSKRFRNDYGGGGGGDDDDDDDDDGDDGDDVGDAATKAPVAPIHAPVPGRPQRSTRANVSYTEKTESEREVIRWERAAAKQSQSQSQTVDLFFKPRNNDDGAPKGASSLTKRRAAESADLENIDPTSGGQRKATRSRR